MSRTLDEMERIASETRISDPDWIKEIVNGFLNMTYRELSGQEYRFGYVAKDIAKGFSLDEDKVRDLKLRDILTVIGYEPAAPWFEIPEDDIWFRERYGSRRFFSAGNCFSLSQIILQRKKEVPLLGRFLKMDYWQFMKYLYDRMVILSGSGNGYPDRGRFAGMQFNRVMQDTEDFVYEYGSVDRGKKMTTEDVLTTACNLGRHSWICGTEPLDSFRDKVFSSYRITLLFFMNSIRMVLIPSDRSAFKSLLLQCSDVDEYEEKYYEELDFSDCFE